MTWAMKPHRVPNYLTNIERDAVGCFYLRPRNILLIPNYIQFSGGFSRFPMYICIKCDSVNSAQITIRREGRYTSSRREPWCEKRNCRSPTWRLLSQLRIYSLRTSNFTYPLQTSLDAIDSSEPDASLE